MALMLPVTSDRIKARRRELAMTREALAVKAGISGATVQRIESGKNSPNLSTLAAIADALEVPVVDLIEVA